MVTCCCSCSPRLAPWKASSDEAVRSRVRPMVSSDVASQERDQPVARAELRESAIAVMRRRARLDTAQP